MLHSSLHSLPDVNRSMTSQPFATRPIPTFAGSQYGTIDTPITFAGDFEVEVKFATTTSGILVGRSDADTPLLYVSPAGIVTARFGDATTGRITTTVTNDGKVHTAIMKRVGTTCSISIDGVEEYSATLTLADVVFDQIGTWISGTLLFSGQILSIKFTDAGTVVANYVFDSGSDLYQLPRGEGLGVEEVTNGTFDTNTDDWSVFNLADLSILNAEMLVTNTGAFYGAATQAITTIVGKSYVLKVDVNYTAHQGRVRVGTTNGGNEHFEEASIATDKTVTTTFTATTATTYLRVGLNTNVDAESIAFDNVSLKQLPDLACLLTNFATTDWNRYTQQRNIAHDAGVINEAWVGTNVVVNGTFDTDLSGWAILNPSAQTVEWIDGELHIDGDGLSAYGATQNILTVNYTYLSKLDYRSISGALKVQVGGGVGDKFVLDTTRKYSLLNTVSASGSPEILSLFRDASVAGEGYIDNVSVQHLLEVA